MIDNSKNIILHYDMDAFYASVEIRDNPSLKGKPIIIGTSVIATCNYEARKYGLHSAMSVSKARLLCPHGIYLKGNMEKYLKVSQQIKTLVLKITNKVEFIASDEGYVDITEIIKKYSSYKTFANKFKNGILRHTGITCSIGIGYNKLTAKLASEAKKPGGTMVINDKIQFHNFIIDKNIGLIPGIGKKTEEILNKKKHNKISDVLKLSRHELRSLLGGSRGEMLYEYVRGIDIRKIGRKTKTHSIGNERTYSNAIDDKDVMWSELLGLLIKTHKRLKIEKSYTKTITLKLRYLNQNSITRSKSIYVTTQNIKELKKVLLELFNKVNINDKIKLLGVTLGNLSKNSKYQLTFNIFRDKIYNNNKLGG